MAGEGWALAVTTRARSRGLPLWGSARCVQLWPDGALRAFTVSVRGRMRVGSVEVEHSAGSSSPAWLRAGRHPALVLEGVQVVAPPR